MYASRVSVDTNRRNATPRPKKNCNFFVKQTDTCATVSVYIIFCRRSEGNSNMTAISNSVRYADLVLQSPSLPNEVRSIFPRMQLFGACWYWSLASYKRSFPSRTLHFTEGAVSETETLGLQCIKLDPFPVEILVSTQLKAAAHTLLYRRIRSRTSVFRIFLISSFPRVIIYSEEVVCFLLGSSPASEFYMPMFRNTLPVPS
jgi:hypothetical protein